MKRIDMILVACGNDEVGLNRISDMLGWKKGPTTNALKQLVERGHVRKLRHGFYIATKEGQRQIKEILKSNPHNDSVVYRTAALFTGESKFDMMETLRYEIKPPKPDRITRELSNIIREIYHQSLDSINFNHADDDFVKSVWRYHHDMICKCGFNFEKAYDIHALRIEKFVNENNVKIDKESLFKNLVWESYPDIEKYKRNFNLPTLYKKPDLPDSWNC